MGSGSHLIACAAQSLIWMQKLEFCQRLPKALPLPPLTSSQAPILNDAFSKPHICDCLYCAFPRNHLGEVRLCEGEGVCACREATKAFRTLGIFLLISSNTPPTQPALPSADILQFTTDSRTK